MSSNNNIVAIRLSYDKHKYLPSKRYISYCDDCWYETTDEPLYNFQVNDLSVIKKQLKHHFIYNAGFIYLDGTEVVWNAFTDKEEQPAKQPAEKKKKGLFIRIKV